MLLDMINTLMTMCLMKAVCIYMLPVASLSRDIIGTVLIYTAEQSV